LLGPQSVIAEGAPHDVLTAENLQRAFGLSAQIMADPISGSPMVIPQ
jgi:iron complex transport system ATP-binding protein